LFAAYLRIALFILGLAGAVILFAFAFTGAAIILIVLLALGAIFGRTQGSNIWIVTRRDQRETRDHPKVIDHDPNDLPR